MATPSDVSLPHDWDVVCGSCGVDVQRGSYCGGCRAVRYCSRDCQRADWPIHRGNCMRLRDLRVGLYKHELPVSAYTRVDQYSDDTTGIIAFEFPGASSNICVFTRRSKDRESMRAFVAHGMYLWERWQCVDFVKEYFMKLKEISDLVFVRGGMLRAATHLHGDRDGIPVLRVRPLTLTSARMHCSCFDRYGSCHGS